MNIRIGALRWLQSLWYLSHAFLLKRFSHHGPDIYLDGRGKCMSFWKKLFGGSPAPAAKPTNVVEEAKDIIRNSSGAHDFLSRATQAGWSKIKEDFIGIYLKKGDATLIFGVLPSHGPDTIWTAMMTTKDTGTVYLITEGKSVI
jgi:hypothetical protein